MKYSCQRCKQKTKHRIIHHNAEKEGKLIELRCTTCGYPSSMMNPTGYEWFKNDRWKYED